jgi:DNA-directed RNA polymerase subunit RPC12/RpoP
MLHDIFMEVLFCCGIVICIFAALVTVKASWRYLFWHSQMQEPTAVPVEPLNGVDMIDAEPLAENISPLTNILPESKDAVIPVLVRPRVLPASLTICGQCRKEIRSNPILNTQSGRTIYLCEHCGSKVALG